MSEVKPELKQCSRCHSNCTLEHYEKNRKGEWFKLCNNCRGKGKDYKDGHKNEIKDNRQQYRETKHYFIHEISECPCGSTYTRNHKSRHIQTQKHIIWLETIPPIETN